jgi:hypothetical protein
MKHLAKIQTEFVKRANKPSFFCSTKYREPTDEELIEINNSNPTVNELSKGLGYSIVGRGIEFEKQKNMIKNVMKRLIIMFPNNKNYKIALQQYKESI